MTPGTSMLQALPRPYTVERTSVIAQLLDVLSLELEIAAEDVGRVRLTHWIEHAYSEEDAERLADLVGIDPLPWEDAATFRARLISLVTSRLRGSTGPLEITGFVFAYLRAAQAALARPAARLEATLLPGLGTVATPAEAFSRQPDRPRYRPLEMVENPPRHRSSDGLAATGGRVAHLQHWHDRNDGLYATRPAVVLVGASRGRTSVPLLVNLTSGEWIGYRGVVPVGARLAISGAQDDGQATATLDGVEVSDRLISSARFPPDPVLKPSQLDRIPRMPMLRRGDNEWMYLSVGLFGVRGVDHARLAFADAVMREASFDESAYDRAIFPVGPVVGIEMTWVEARPASFEVRVPHGITVEPSGRPPLAGEVARALASSIDELRAAGVTAELALVPFEEHQPHRPSVRLPWVVLPAEHAPTGTEAEFTVGGRFDETVFGRTRFA